MKWGSLKAAIPASIDEHLEFLDKVRFDRVVPNARIRLRGRLDLALLVEQITA